MSQLDSVGQKGLEPTLEGVIIVVESSIMMAKNGGLVNLFEISQLK